jgi:transcriptional regulator with XRE-family HTH domain
MTHRELKKTALRKPEVQAEYEALGTEFELLRQMLKARQEAGLTQAQVAERMGTKAPAVTRLESSLTSGKHSPSLATLRKYAKAVGFHLEIRLVRTQAGPNPRLRRMGDNGRRVGQQPQRRSAVAQPQLPNRRALDAKTIAGAER